MSKRGDVDSSGDIVPVGAARKVDGERSRARSGMDGRETIVAPIMGIDEVDLVARALFNLRAHRLWYDPGCTMRVLEASNTSLLLLIVTQYLIIHFHLILYTSTIVR